MVQIIPAILATTEEQYATDLQKLSSCEALKDGWVHIDFADNKFVQNKTVGVETIQKFPTNFHKEAHLMISNPKGWIDSLERSGFERVIIHIESENVSEAIDYAVSKGIKVGIAVKNETDIEKVTPFIDKIDTILIMSIVAGFQGQPFIPASLKKIKQVKSQRWSVRVGLDGSVKDTNIKEIMQNDADFVIMGSYFLKGDTDENLEKLWEALK